MYNTASVATLTLSEDELALGNGLPSAYDGSPAVRGKFVAAGRVGRRFSKKRARTVDLIHQPPAKRHEAIRLYPIAARGRKRAAGADEGGVADCVQGSSRADSAGSQRVTRSKKDKTFPKSSGVQLGHDSLVQESEGPRSGKVPENPTATSQDQRRALKAAIWSCKRAGSLYDEGVTVDHVIPATSHDRYKNLDEETVFAAIASMWRAFLPHNPCSFSSAAFFQEARSKKAQLPVAPASGILIIPLLFNTSTFVDASKQSIEQQWVLVIARHGPQDNRVWLEFCYHRPGQENVPESERIGELTKEQIRQAAQTIVRNAGWLSKPPAFAEERENRYSVCESIANKGGTFSSGHLVVLTAWSYMLGFPIPDQLKPGVRHKEDLCRAIQRLIAMALDGRLTAEVIDLFIQVYFAAEKFRKEDAQTLTRCRERLKNVQTYCMNTEILDNTLDALRKDPKCFARSLQQAKSTTSRSNGSDRVVSSRASKQRRKTRLPSPSLRKRDKLYWQTTYRNWMRAHKGAVRKCIRHNSSKPLWAHAGCHLKDPESAPYQLTDDQVFGGVGALWRARWESGRSKRLGFGDANAFQWYRAEDNLHEVWGQDYGVVGGSEATSQQGKILPLMIPLCGDHTPDFRTGNGHWVFLVARQAGGGEGGHITLHLWNSAEGLGQRAGIVAQAKGLVERCGWLRDVEPIWHDVESIACPAQRVLNTCGVYVVLNAWCYQLDLATPAERLFSTNERQDEAFIHVANLMINLALYGDVDSDGIRAFLMASGYCGPADMRTRQAGDNVRCGNVGAECRVLASFIRRVRQEERGEEVSLSSGSRRPTRSSG